VSATVALPTGRPHRLGIVHSTGFRYPGQVLASYNEARMTPLTTPRQTTLEARIEVIPTASTFRYGDYWGTQVTAFEVRVPHDRLTVTARAIVETYPAPVSKTSNNSWADLSTESCRDRYAELLVTTTRTEPGQEAVALAREVVSGLAPAEAGRAVTEWLSGVLDYVPGATGVHTSAAQAWDVRKGVCQDFAHVPVGILRSLGIPARYVSGYLQPRSDAEVGEKCAEKATRVDRVLVRLMAGVGSQHRPTRWTGPRAGRTGTRLRRGSAAQGDLLRCRGR